MADAGASHAKRLTLRAGARTLALDLAEVAEVARPPALTPVPLAPPALAGLASLRGRVVPVVSLAALLGEPGEAAASGRRVVVLRRDDPIALSVDAIDSRDEAAADAAEGPVGGLDALLREAFAAVRTARPVRPAAGVSGALASRAETAKPVSILVFTVAGQAYGLRLAEVFAVVRPPPDILRLAGRDPVALGVVEHRGAPLPVLSPAALLGLESPPPTAHAAIVVTAVGGAPVGLLADSVRGVLRAGEDDLRPAPAILNRGRGEAEVEAVVRSADGLVGLIAPERLLRDAPIPTTAHPDASRSEPTAMATNDLGPTELLLAFRIGEETYALPVAAVVEVVTRPETLDRAPNAGPFLAGVMSHRGQPLSVLDPRAGLGLDAGPARGRGRVVALDVDGLRCGLAVDAVEGLVRIEAARLAQTTPLAEAGAQVFHRTAQVELDGRPVLVVDPKALVTEAARLVGKNPNRRAAPRPA